MLSNLEYEDPNLTVLPSLERKAEYFSLAADPVHHIFLSGGMNDAGRQVSAMNTQTR